MKFSSGGKEKFRVSWSAQSLVPYLHGNTWNSKQRQSGHAGPLVLLLLLVVPSLLCPGSGGQKEVAGPLAPLGFHSSMTPLTWRSQSIWKFKVVQKPSLNLFCFSFTGTQMTTCCQAWLVLCSVFFILSLLAFLSYFNLQFSLSYPVGRSAFPFFHLDEICILYHI